MKWLIPSDIRDKAAVFIRILEYVKPYKKRLVMGIIASVFAGIFGFSPVLLLKELFDRVIPLQKPEYLYAFSALIVVVFAVKGVTEYAQSYLMSWVGQNVIMDMRRKTFRHLVTLPLSFFKQVKAGELIARIVSDISLMEMAVSRVLGRMVLSFFSLLPPLVAVFYFSWKLALIAVFVLPLTLYPIIEFARKLKRVSTTGQEQMANLTGTMSETFYGIQVVKAYNMEDLEARRFKTSNRDYYNAMMKAARVSALSPPLMELIGALAAAVIFGFGLKMYFNGVMTQGSLIAFVGSLFMMYDPIKKISKVNYDVQRAVAGAERIFDLIDRTTDIEEKEDAIELNKVNGKIKLDGVGFYYEPSQYVLKDIELDIEPGETIAIVGISGAGKSTLSNLIPRFYDVRAGAILIDDIDIRDVTVKSLRQNIGIVTQETILFNDTVRNNLCYGRDDVPENVMIKACKMAHAHGFIENLENGYNTVIGERGVNLSGGQRQRLAIARAIIKDPPILILDEATSSLDSESEKLIQKALDQLMKNRTTIVIAHRLSTIRKATRIVVIENGRFVEIGSHEELLKRQGVYRHLYSLQTMDDYSAE